MMGKDQKHRKRSSKAPSDWAEIYFSVCNENTSKRLDITTRALFVDETTKSILTPSSSCDWSSAESDLECRHSPKEYRYNKNADSFNSPVIKSRKLRPPPAPKKKKKRFYVI